MSSLYDSIIDHAKPPMTMIGDRMNAQNRASKLILVSEAPLTTLKRNVLEVGMSQPEQQEMNISHQIVKVASFTPDDIAFHNFFY